MTEKDPEQQKRAKKEELAAQAEQESHLSSLRDKFITMELAPRDLIEEEDEGISPAIDFDEQAYEEELKHRPKPEPVVEPEPEPKPPVSKEELGAAGFLLSGSIPVDSDDKHSDQSEAHDGGSEPVLESTAEQPDESEPSQSSEPTEPAPQTHAPQTQAPEADISESRDESVDSTPSSPVSPSSEPEESAINESADKESSNPATTQEDDDSDSGVFSKAKSLFANITKKDKKE